MVFGNGYNLAGLLFLTIAVVGPQGVPVDSKHPFLDLLERSRLVPALLVGLQRLDNRSVLIIMFSSLFALSVHFCGLDYLKSYLSVFTTIKTQG